MDDINEYESLSYSQKKPELNNLYGEEAEQLEEAWK